MKNRKYKVIVTETYEKEFEVFATSEETATAAAADMADNDNIMCNDEYYSGRTFKVNNID